MTGYLEAYRLARAKAQDPQTSAAAPATGNDQRATAKAELRNREEGRAYAAASESTGSADSKIDTSRVSSARSFQAAKLTLDKVQNNTSPKDAKEKVMRWSSNVEPTSPVARDVPTLLTRKGTLGQENMSSGVKSKLQETSGNGEPESKDDVPGIGLENEVRTAGVPKKRIVSDEHWLTDRSSPKISSLTSSPLKFSPLLRETKLYARPGSNRPDAWVRRKSTPGKRVSSLGEKKQVTFEDVGEQDAANDTGARGILRDASKEDLGRSQNLKAATPTRLPVKASAPDAQMNPPNSAPAKVGKVAEVELPQPVETKVTPRKGAWTRKRPPRRDPSPSEFSSDERGSSLEEDEENAPPKPFQSRMSAWLSKTPDPFVEKLDDPHAADMRPLSVSDTGSMIAPRKTSIRQDGARNRSGRRVRSSGGSRSPPQSDSDDNLDTASPTSKRNGPRRSEPRNRELQLAEALPPRASTKQASPQEATGHAASAKRRQSNKQDNAKRPNNRTLASHADLLSVLSRSHGVKGIVSARSVRTARKQPESATLTDLMSEVRSDEAKYIRELRTLVDGVIPVLLSSVLSSGNGSSLDKTSRDQLSKEKSKETIISLGVALERLHNLHKRLPTGTVEEFVAWTKECQAPYENYIRAWRLGFQNVVINLALADTEGMGVKGDGERVDVTFFLKRPMVRLKYLARTLKGIDHARSSEETKSMSTKYQSLVEEARLKQDREHARLEDEAAANIDPTRVRDPETFAPLPRVSVNQNRCVRARDIFDMRMHHSSGQRLDCHVMLFLRDDFSGFGNRGDVLVAEVDSSSRWLLFPPAELAQLSARLGTSKREVVIMLRGSSGIGQEWRELMSLEAETAETASEWVKMLGSNPLPPPITPSKGFRDPNLSRQGHGKSLVLAPVEPGRPPTPSELDVPLGEQSVLSFSRSESPQATFRESNTPARYHGRNKSAQLPVRLSYNQPDLSRGARKDYGNGAAQVSSAPPSPRHNNEVSESDRRAELASMKVNDWLSRGPQPFDERSSAARHENLSDATDYAHMDVLRKGGSQRPTIPRRLSTVPSEGHLSVSRNRYHNAPPTAQDTRQGPSSGHNTSPNTLTQPVNSSRSSPVQLRGASTPHFSPSTPNANLRRRSSSPLKYEYAPSSDSEGSSAMVGMAFDDEDSVTSESSVDDLVPDPRMPSIALRENAVRSSFANRYTPRGAHGESPTSQSHPGDARGLQEQGGEVRKVVASIYSWSDKGLWNLLHPDDCSIVVSPGLIEAFEMSAAHSAPGNAMSAGSPRKGNRHVGRPLVALELTPLVPLRQSTAIDITIRSPPTANSQLRAGSNIMFRSRTGGECEFLYNLINQARINNPTYIALQNARGPVGGSNWASYMDQQASRRGGSSWWRLGSKKSSYRAGNTRRSGSLVETVSSVASMSSAISALKRLGNGSNVFNIGRSTISSRGALSNQRSNSSFESSSGSSTPAAIDHSQASPAGLTDMKIRLYEREEASKWRDMGSARLTIMHPPRPNVTMIDSSGHVKQEKRIVITGKTRGETLLDVTLGETSFERVARTGVAVKVWEQFDQMAKTGGVAGTRMRVYMIQMKSEAEAAYTFSLVGRLRY